MSSIFSSWYSGSIDLPPGMPGPQRKPVRKAPCSLCHKLVEELQYHYDICEPCHQDIVADDPYGADDDESDFVEGASDSDDDIPGVPTNLNRSVLVPLERHVSQDVDALDEDSE